MIQLDLSTKTEKRLKQIMLLHNDNDSFFNKVIDYQIKELKIGLHNMLSELQEFEKKYNMESSVFYAKFEKGELDDRHDFILWSGVYEMYLRDKKKVKNIEW